MSIRRFRTARVRVAAGALGVAALVSLTGCGSSLSPQMHPGAAAVIGDSDPITLEQVDAEAEDVCRLFEPQFQQMQNALPMSAVRSIGLDLLVQQRAAELYAEAHDIPLPSFEKLKRQAAQQAPQQDVPEDLVDEYAEFSARQAVRQQVELAAGEDEGGGDPAAAQEAGAKKVAAWVEEQGLDVDPRFGTYQDGIYEPPEALSEPVGDLAKLSADLDLRARTSQKYLAQLPDSQVCG